MQHPILASDALRPRKASCAAAGGAVLRVDVVHVGFEHVVAGDADAVDARARLIGVITTVMRIFSAAVVLSISVVHDPTVSLCDAAMSPSAVLRRLLRHAQ
jgi:hypothetical protein